MGDDTGVDGTEEASLCGVGRWSWDGSTTDGDSERSSSDHFLVCIIAPSEARQEAGASRERTRCGRRCGTWLQGLKVSVLRVFKFMIGRHYLSIPSTPFRSRRSFRLRGRKSPSIAGVSLDDNQPIHRRHPLRSVLQDDAYVESIRQMRDSVDGAIRPTDHQIINFRVPFQRR